MKALKLEEIRTTYLQISRKSAGTRTRVFIGRYGALTLATEGTRADAALSQTARYVGTYLPTLDLRTLRDDVKRAQDQAMAPEEPV